jgi:glycosyltransferase involved in cell wall biosynthesis
MIAFLEPYYAGSHRYFADKFVKLFDADLFTLPGRHWKWRMHGASIKFADMIKASGKNYDTIVVSSLADAALLRSLLVDYSPKMRIITYFHENQLVYPWSKDDKGPEKRKDLHYGFINFTSALASNKVVFNSKFNQDSFLGALESFLKSFPDKQPIDKIEEIRNKSTAIHPGIEVPEIKEKTANDIPVILWNHRWEFDKDPDEFFNTLIELIDSYDFKVIVCGEERKNAPAIFQKAREILADRIIHFGFAKDRKTYFELLEKCDIAPVTAKHEFFGLSVLEAAASGVIPVLPKRLSYPELFPQQDFTELFYADGKLKQKLEQVLRNYRSFDTKFIKRSRDFSWDRAQLEFNKIIGGNNEKNYQHH